MNGAAFVVFTMATALIAQSVWDGVYTAAQAKRGEGTYAERCASCHQPDLSGMDQAPALTGADFASEWNDQPLADLFERVRVTMPGDKPGTLDRDTVADVVSFILQKNGFPDGSAALPAEGDALKAVKFLAKKP
jgi:mono/diheme cytochrome c family protein